MKFRKNMSFFEQFDYTFEVFRHATTIYIHKLFFHCFFHFLSAVPRYDFPQITVEFRINENCSSSGERTQSSVYLHCASKYAFILQKKKRTQIVLKNFALVLFYKKRIHITSFKPFLDNINNLVNFEKNCKKLLKNEEKHIIYTYYIVMM